MHLVEALSIRYIEAFEVNIAFVDRVFIEDLFVPSIRSSWSSTSSGSLFDRSKLLGGFTLSMGDDRLIETLPWDELCQLDEEASLGEHIEDEEEMLPLLIKEILQSGLRHQIAVFVRTHAHIHHRHLLLLLPVLVTEVEGGQLIMSVAEGIKDEIV